MSFESFGDNTNEIKTKENKIADTGSIIDINNNTKKKSIEEIKEIFAQKLHKESNNVKNFELNSIAKKSFCEEIENKVCIQIDDSDELLAKNKHSKLTLNQMKLLSSKIKESTYVPSKIYIRGQS